MALAKHTSEHLPGPPIDIPALLEAEAKLEDHDRFSDELEAVQKYIRKGMDSEAIEGCAPAECVALLISQRDNARAESEALQAKLARQAEVLRAAKEALAPYAKITIEEDNAFVPRPAFITTSHIKAARTALARITELEREP